MLKHNGLTVALVILIACLLLCNITKFLFGKQRVDKPKQEIDQFSNVYNEINYFPSKCQQQPSYCPGQHPKIPCNMINTCNGAASGANMDPAIQEYVDSYVYLISLLYSIKSYLPGGTV